MQVSNAYRTQTHGTAMIVRLAAAPDLAAAESMPRGAQRKQAVWDALQATAAASQAPLLAVADALHGAGLVTDVQSLTSPNALVVTPTFGQAKAVFEAFQREGVDSIWSNFDGSLMWSPATGVVEPELPGAGSGEQSQAPSGWAAGARSSAPTSSAPTNWGLAAIGAPAAWADGVTGAGLVYGSIDSGVDGSHPALRDAYRGAMPDGSVVHDHNWMDLELPWSGGPTDPMGHGTHTTGTAVGAGVGVAPGARWIGVSAVNGAADSFLKAMQWMQAPTRVDGTDPDPAAAPDVIGMSWGFGVDGQDLFGPSLHALAAAGIELVKSAGNDGALGPGSIGTPANYDEVIVVGSVDEQGRVAASSSRGPATRPDGTQIAKPDLVAPGVHVPSSTPGGAWREASGTSMAQPHVAGAVLLVLERYPQLTHSQLVEALTSSARDIEAPGWDPDSGAGVLDVPAALAAAERILARDTVASAA
jgi:subtilisin family serine protease